MNTRINNCRTIAELRSIERMYTLNEVEQRLLFEKQMEIFQRIREWRVENEQLGLIPDFTETWTPEQREAFMYNWQNDEHFIQVNEGDERYYEAMIDESLTQQVGRGQKRSSEEMSEDDVVRDNFFTVNGIKQVNVKKFKTTGTNYTIQFTDTFVHLELSRFHERLHEIFQSVLDRVTHDIPSHDQVRFVLHSPQLEYPISLPFMPRQRLTTERVLAEFERVIQSNHEFHLNDTVNVDLIHVEMPYGGKGTKRSHINLEKHLERKGSFVRIQNKDDLCLARALVIAKAKIDNDSRDRLIRKPERRLQTRLAR